jgi:hypothetical protein
MSVSVKDLGFFGAFHLLLAKLSHADTSPDAVG